MRKVIIAIVVFVLLLSCAIAVISGKMRPVTRAIVAACDTVPSHFTIVNGKVTQNNSLSTIINVFPNQDLNNSAMFIDIDSWDVEDWKLGAYIILGVHYEFGIPPINAYEIGLYEQWAGDKPECRIGFGPQTNALINTYIEWMNNPSKRPTKEQCREKIGVVR